MTGEQLYPLFAERFNSIHKLISYNKVIQNFNLRHLPDILPDKTTSYVLTYTNIYKYQNLGNILRYTNIAAFSCECML